MRWYRGLAVLPAVLLVTGCGYSDESSSGPGASSPQATQTYPSVQQPADDPAHGIYNYEHAKALGLPVPAMPPPDELCTPDLSGDGISPDELDTPEERAALEERMATAPSCRVDPRESILIVGYSIEAVAAADSAYEKGKLICSSPGAAATFFRPGLLIAGEQDYPDLVRARLRSAYGVEEGDDPEEVVRGCAATELGRELLSGPDETASRIRNSY